MPTDYTIKKEWYMVVQTNELTGRCSQTFSDLSGIPFFKDKEISERSQTSKGRVEFFLFFKSNRNVD